MGASEVRPLRCRSRVNKPSEDVKEESCRSFLAYSLKDVTRMNFQDTSTQSLVAFVTSLESRLAILLEAKVGPGIVA